MNILNFRKTQRSLFLIFGAIVATAAVAQFVGPVVPIVGKRTAGFFDPSYAKTEQRQHLGVDISAKAGADVRSPVDGSVVLNNTGVSDVMQAYLVIKSIDGEHVLGHISSNLKQNDKVTRNQIVGKVREWPGNSHVHWGINKKGVAQAMAGTWGWGRAALTAKIKDATDKGWVNF
jgi:murein DD-endopeptidase MepM/ murein hydrolase activator NlpD